MRRPARASLTRRRTTSSIAIAGIAALGMLAACATPGSDPTTPSTDAATMDPHKPSTLVANNPQPRERLRTGGTLTLSVSLFPSQWNLFNREGSDADTGYILSATDPLLYDYAVDGTVSPRPEFLTALPTETIRDGKQVITYLLNPKAKWNDGTPIDYRSFEALRKVNAMPAHTGGYDNVVTTGFEDIESVAAGIRPGEVVVTMRPGRAFYPVTELFTSVLHPAAAQSPDVFNKAFVDNFHPEWRAGPFTLDTLNTTEKTIALVRNPNWWGPPALLDRVIFRAMEDSATIPAFKAGELDALSVSTASRFAQVQGVENADIRRSVRLFTSVLVFNSAKAPLSDIAVRKAMWQAIDRNQWNDIRYKGMNWTEKPINSATFFPFQPQVRDNMPVTHSVADAKKTLETAGYRLGSDGVYAKDGRRLTVPFTYFGDDPLFTSLAQTLRTQSAAAGIDVQLDNRPLSAFPSTTNTKDFTLVNMGWQSTTPSPVMNICQVMCTDGPGNLSGVGSSALDRRIRGASAIKDPAQQSDEINAIEKDWLTGYGQLPMVNGPDIWVYRAGIANLGPAAFASLQPTWEDVGWMADAS